MALFSSFSRLLLLAFAAVVALVLSASQGASAARSLSGLPTAINDIQVCQQFASYIQQGQVPPGACDADTQATIKRCLGYAGVSAADQKTILDNIALYCQQQG